MGVKQIESLETISYLIELRPVGQTTIYYYVDEWPNPELNKMRMTNYPIGILDSMYYTTELALATVFSSARTAQKTVSDICGAERSIRRETWLSIRTVPVKQQLIFKARLKGTARSGAI